jgi:hypothetical protein
MLPVILLALVDVLVCAEQCREQTFLDSTFLQECSLQGTTQAVIISNQIYMIRRTLHEWCTQLTLWNHSKAFGGILYFTASSEMLLTSDGHTASNSALDIFLAIVNLSKLSLMCRLYET